MICRAATLGIKYAMLSDVLLSGDVKGGLNGDSYRGKSMPMRGQMTSYIANVDGQQKENLVREFIPAV